MTTATGTTVLKTALATYAHTKALKDGSVTAPGVRLEHVEVSPIVAAFRRMVRTLEFDVSEMAITTYLTAKAHGKAFTALPVFVMRQFHHTPIVYNVKSGVKSPKDLEGKKVGVRAYTVTTGVWARGILATEYGVDLDKVTWVVVDEEHVREYQKPANVLERPGANLGEMVAKGELAAAIGAGAVDSPDVMPLFVHPREAEAAWYRKTAVFLKQLDSGATLPADAQAVAQRRSVVGDDPLPYGVAKNRKALEAIIQFARDQKILPRAVTPEEMFPRNTLDLE